MAPLIVVWPWCIHIPPDEQWLVSMGVGAPLFVIVLVVVLFSPSWSSLSIVGVGVVVMVIFPSLSISSPTIPHL